ncbi:MAG: cellulose-binding protein [Acidimicrobiaceae bacterium]|nr:cellulose-binding protein [Acidimicrobiaceae bacterium]
MFSSGRLFGVLAAILIGAGSLSPTLTSASVRTVGPSVGDLHIRGNRLVSGTGTPVELLGLNRSGTEYACAQGWGIFDGPSGPGVAAAMKTWSIDAVRVVLNEDCWLGINVLPAYSGAAYQQAIGRYVQELSARGIVAILDLHWSAPGTQRAEGQSAMPDATHAVAFWRSVARTFRENPRVAFELFNEPHDVSWACWKSGCAMPGGWQAVGMQSLIDAVRRTGAPQPIIVDGLNWGNDLSGWLTHRLHDPRQQLAAGFHLYPWTACASRECWDSSVAAVARSVPVVTTEVGERDCTGSFFTDYLDWAVPQHISVLAWTFNDNQGCLSLIRGPISVPTKYGAAVLRDFKRFARDETS